MRAGGRLTASDGCNPSGDAAGIQSHLADINRTLPKLCPVPKVVPSYFVQSPLVALLNMKSKDERANDASFWFRHMPRRFRVPIGAERYPETSIALR